MEYRYVLIQKFIQLCFFFFFTPLLNCLLCVVLFHVGNESNMDKAKKSMTNSDIVSISKKITVLEMKELNERQRAEHCQKMYEHLRTSLKHMEERNFELETKFTEV